MEIADLREAEYRWSEFYVVLMQLRNYVELNYMGFHKIFERYDAMLSSEKTRNKEVHPFFVPALFLVIAVPDVLHRGLAGCDLAQGPLPRREGQSPQGAGRGVAPMEGGRQRREIGRRRSWWT